MIGGHSEPLAVAVPEPRVSGAAWGGTGTRDA